MLSECYPNAISNLILPNAIRMPSPSHPSTSRHCLVLIAYLPTYLLTSSLVLIADRCLSIHGLALMQDVHSPQRTHASIHHPPPTSSAPSLHRSRPAPSVTHTYLAHTSRRSSSVHSSKCGDHASNTWRRYIGKLEGAAARTVNVTVRGHRQSVAVSPSAGISSEAARGGCPHMARHFLGTVKPWKRTKRGSVDLNLGRVATYLLTVRYQHLVNSSRCARYFAKLTEERAINATMHAILRSGNVDVGGHPQQVR